MKSVFISIIATCFIVSCVPESFERIHVHGRGERVEQVYKTIDFNECTFNGPFRVYLYEAKEPEIVVYAQENILEILEIKESGKSVSIGFDRHYNVINADEIVIEIYKPAPVEMFTINGAVTMDYEEGSVETVTYNVNGVAVVNHNEFLVDNCYIFINGTGTFKVNVSEYLKVEINGMGDVRYSGSPELHKVVHGIGTVSKN